MGYNTHFSLKLEPEDWSIIDDLRSENDEAESYLDDDGSVAEEGKWYEHQDQLVEFSKKYPDTLFALSGAGEEGGDLWILYVKNGRYQRAEAIITYPPCQL